MPRTETKHKVVVTHSTCVSQQITQHSSHRENWFLLNNLSSRSNPILTYINIQNKYRRMYNMRWYLHRLATPSERMREAQ